MLKILKMYIMKCNSSLNVSMNFKKIYYGDYVTSTFFRVCFVVERRELEKRVLFVCSLKAENCE